jgi:hypothetical protein
MIMIYTRRLLIVTIEKLEILSDRVIPTDLDNLKSDASQVRLIEYT